MNVSKFRKYLGFVFHWLFFVTMVSSMFWLAWYYIFLIFLLLRIQDYFFGGCILTWVEYGDFKRRWVVNTFIANFINKRKIPVKYMGIFIDYFIPLIIVILAYFIQE